MRTIFLSILLILLGVAILFLLKDLPVIKPPVQKHATQQITIKSIHITNAKDSDRYRIDVSYPQISGLSNTKTQQKINEVIRKDMNQHIAEFQEAIQTSDQSALPKPFENFVNEFYTKYELARVDNSIVSIRFSIMDFRVGMDHPNNYDQVFNYDVKKEKQIQLADVFKPNSKYLVKLSDLTKEQLTERFKSNPYAGDFISRGTKPEGKNFELFNISQNNLVITFNPYQVAPYYAGAQTVRIPIPRLKDILRPGLVD